MRWAIVAIQTLVAAQFDLTRAELLSRDRHRRIARPRQVAMYLTYQPYSTRSLGQVAKFFGMGDHTTVLHACRQVERLCAADPAFGARILALKAELSFPAVAPDNQDDASQGVPLENEQAAT